jgi:hypothetical protein
MRRVAAFVGNMGTMLGPTVLRDCTSIGSDGGFHSDGTELDNRHRMFRRVHWRDLAHGAAVVSIERPARDGRGNNLRANTHAGRMS